MTFVRAVLLLLLVSLSHEAAADDPFEAFFRSQGIHPAHGDTDWANEAQGIATDGTYWYLSQVDRLTKVPVSQDLGRELPRRAASIALDEIPDLADTGLDHFGDVSWFRPAGAADGFVLVPLDRSDGLPPYPVRLAFFRDRDLALVDLVPLPCTGSREACGGTGQVGFGWVAVDRDGRLASSGRSSWVVHLYRVDWASIGTGSARMELERVVPLRGEDGRSLRLVHTQGGSFSPSGRRLYLTTGYPSGLCSWGGGVAEHELDGLYGIHVLDTEHWQRVAKSTSRGGSFAYAFDPTFPACDEPEGLTIWDFGGAPDSRIEGQLHVLTLSNGLLADRVSLHHYGGTLYVRDGAPEGGDGSRASPYSRLVDALGVAWPGARIQWQPGREDPGLSPPFRLPVLGGEVSVRLPPAPVAPVSAAPVVPSAPGEP